MPEQLSLTDNLPTESKSSDLSAEQNEIYLFLKSISEFKILPDLEIVELAKVSHFSIYSPGEQIVTEGQAEDNFGFIMVSGVVTMHKTSTNGRILIVELLKTGDIFNLLLMLADQHLPNQLTAKSLQRVQTLWVPISYFNQMLMRNPVLFKEIVAHLLLCLQCSYRLARGLAHDRVDVRIASILTSLSHKFSKPLGYNSKSTIHFTRQQLADLTGTTCETAIRVTRAMQRDGLIDISKPGIIKISDPKSLQDLSEM